MARNMIFNPRPSRFWRALRVFNYLFWLSAFLAIAGYFFRVVMIFVDSAYEEAQVNLVYYFVVSTAIFSVGLP